LDLNSSVSNSGTGGVDLSSVSLVALVSGLPFLFLVGFFMAILMKAKPILSLCQLDLSAQEIGKLFN
jgi:hypothetical protein